MLLTYKADLIYGASGTGKTTQLGEAARYFCKKTGKKARIVSADGGGFDPLLDLVASGLLEVWPIADHPEQVWAIDAACQGYWPVDVNDPKSKLLPPTAETWKNICFIGFEGLTSFGDAILLHLERKRARLSQEPSYVWSEGPASYAGGNMTYYGFVQARLYEFVMKSQHLPVERAPWTALEGRGEEEGTKAPTFGPLIAGRKAVGKASQWFGNTFHLENAVTPAETDPTTKQQRLVVRHYLYLKPHAEPTLRIAFPAKVRLPLSVAHKVPEYFDLTQDGNPNRTTLGTVYELLDSLTSRDISSKQGEKTQ